MVTMALAAVDITIVATSIPEIVADLSGLQFVSWLFSIYLLAQTVTIPIYGKLSDLYGRKTPRRVPGQSASRTSRLCFAASSTLGFFRHWPVH